MNEQENTEIGGPVLKNTKRAGSNKPREDEFIGIYIETAKEVQ